MHFLPAEMTFGYSRDDISKFLPVYLEDGILQYDPFQVCCVLLLLTVSTYKHGLCPFKIQLGSHVMYTHAQMNTHTHSC